MKQSSGALFAHVSEQYDRKQRRAKEQRGFRERVWDRDRGVCALCGLDTELLSRVVFRLAARRHGPNQIVPAPQSAPLSSMALLVALGWSERAAFVPAVDEWRRRSLWHADHVVPVVSGGGYETENGRTLCVPCHIRRSGDDTTRRSSELRERIHRLLWTWP